MKIFCVMTLAHQIDGEFVLAKPEKAFTQASKADEYVRGLANVYQETIATPVGSINCQCQRSVFEFELEGA